MSGIASRTAPWLALFAALAAAVASSAWVQDENLRVVIDIAGDDGLPGGALFPTWQETRAFTERLGESRDAYLAFLYADSWGAAALLAVFAATIWATWRRAARLWHVALAAAAAAYAASDWTENALLASAVRSATTEAGPYIAASVANSAKWLFGAAAAAVAARQLAAWFGPWRPWFLALFYDVPFFVDRASRRLEFRLNSEFAADPRSPGGLRPRPAWQLVPFWLFGTSVVFLCYGPTLDGFCSLSPGAARGALGLAGLGLAAALAWLVWRKARPWVLKRLNDYPFPSERGCEAEDAAHRAKRHWVTVLGLGSCGALVLAPGIFAAFEAVRRAIQGVCAGSTFSEASLWRLVLCAVAIAAFAAAWRSTSSTWRLAAWQAAILAATAAVYWLVLAAPEATEASGEPYRHVFAVAAPALAIIVALSALIARWALRKPLAEPGDAFRRALRERELFKSLPPTPLPRGAHVWHALFYGIAYRWLQFALIPALIALVAPAEWLLYMIGLGAAVSTGLSTWGNLAPRWRQMVLHVERWFLSGTAFFVSIFVIVIAACRVFGVSYVTTILDGAPFGVIFSGTVMCYAASWLVEYWINRAAASELLGVLGNREPRTAMAYPYAAAPGVAVEQAGRYLVYHGLGRFLVLGKVAGRRSPAFETYGMTELFAELAPEAAVAVNRQVHLYFYAVNFLLAAAAVAFALTYWVSTHLAQPPAVVSAQAGAGGRLYDLAERLLAAPGDERPAVVVAASGGGTRAAVYAAHVLEGLHGIGVDRDIVLMSGVSGGGVALAYFALHYPELSAAARAGRSDKWKRFMSAIEANYIDDVLKGAAEWRVLGAEPLTVLLKETFERRLFAGAGRAPTFDLPGAPGLILNTTVTGHPDEESALLMVGLDRPDGCAEKARPYKLMAGGRLIFTNVGQVSAFPRRDVPIADVRLPYVIVRDPAVGLAPAAALNANFPPVFPNARVEVRNQDPNAECPDRSYFVTDGGAEENLGLVSALLAVQSALEEIAARCKDARAPGCGRKLRRIHFVIAEASATGYDYEQDRGLSAGLEGAKDRMTGGLTNTLIAEAKRLYRASPASPVPAASPEHEADRWMRFHFLAMPLVFRSRGGIGTHWTHAESFTLSDPRARSSRARWGDTVDLRWSEITRMWTALHDPEARFCDDASYGNVSTDKVRRWICGWRFGGNRPRDLHVLEWRTLVSELKSPPAAP